MATPTRIPYRSGDSPQRPQIVPVPPAVVRMPSAIVTGVALLVITIAGGVLRFWNSTGQSLRLDEGFTIRFASYPLQAIDVRGHVVQSSFWQIIAADVHPPGYLLLMHFWMQHMGGSLAVLRFPSEVAGTLAIPALFLFAASLYDRRVGLLAALIGALSPFWIWHAQEARMYPFLLLFTTLSSYGLVTALREGRTWGWPIWFFASLAAIYTQYFAFFVLAAQGAFMVLYLRQITWRRAFVWAGLLVVMAVLYLPWVLEFHRYYKGASDPSLTKPDIYTPLILLANFLFGYLTTPITSEVIAAWPLLVPLALAMGIFAGAISRRAAFLWLMFLIPLILAFAVTLTFKPFISVRYLVVVTPALYTLIAVALARLQGSLVRTVVTAGLVAVLVLSWRVEEISAANPMTEDYRVVASYIQQHAQPGDAVLLDANFNSDAYFYSARNNLPTYGFPSASMGRGGLSGELSAAVLRRTFDEIEAGRKHLWAVYYLETNYDPGNRVRHYLAYHSAGVHVILGGPYRRDQSKYPDSYRSVQLVEYDLISTRASDFQLRPETLSQQRAMTRLSATPRYPAAPAFGPRGEIVPMLGTPAPIPMPAQDWRLQVPVTGTDRFLTIFNPNPQTVRVNVQIAPKPGSTSFSIPGHSNIDVRMSALRAAPGSTMTIVTSSTTVAGVSWRSRHTETIRYGVRAYK